VVNCDYGYRWYYRGPYRETKEEAEKDQEVVAEMRLLLAQWQSRLQYEPHSALLLKRIDKILGEKNGG
jgi:hypothetical protein